MRIDFHTHSFPDPIAKRVAENLCHAAHSIYYICPDIQSLTESMKTAGIDYSVNLPVVTREDQTVPVNDRMIASYEAYYSRGILCFGGMHPDFPNYKEEIRRLHANGIKGIKIHPPYQNADLNDIRYKRIIGAASEEGMIVSTHAGLDIGLPDRNYASAEMILDVLKDVRPDKFVLAHFGGWHGWDEFEKKLAGAPVYLDTSFSLGSITPVKGEESLLLHNKNLSSEEFVRLSKLHGTEKILFATDSPWADQKEYADIVQNSTLSIQEKENIFYRNARNLLGLTGS